MLHFGPQNNGSSELWICTNDFLKMFHTERVQEVHEIYINGFSKKKPFLGKWAILGPKMMHGHKSGSALKIFFKFCTIKEAKKYIKIILIFFLKNSHSGQ